jgi:hypothetical protein
MPRDVERDEQLLLERWQARTQCPPPDLLLPAHEEAVLPEEVGVAVRAHVATCALCTELMAALADAASDPTAEETQRIEQRRRFQTRGRFRGWPSLAAAAALIAVAGAVYLARTAQRPAAPVAQSSGPPAPPAPVQRAAVLTLAAPAIMLPPESLTLRGEPRSAYALALEDALAPFAAGKYPDAAARLEKVAKDHPRRPHAEFYRGTARLMSGDAAAAVGPLQTARELAPRGSPLSDEVAWYLAIALERSGRREEAAGPLNDICGGGGPRKAQACDGLRLIANR